MKTKATVAALILMLSPASAFAFCQGGAHDAEQQASMSCAEGMTYDADQNTCVTEVTG